MILARELAARTSPSTPSLPVRPPPLFPGGKSDEQVRGLAQAAPLERLGTPEDIAEVAAFLAGPGRWINGQVVYASGGLA